MSERHPIADALLGVPGETQPLEWLSGALVTAVSTAAEPHTVTVRLADGATVPGVPLLGWWAPTVDARVEVLRRGTALMVIGPVAPAALATAAAAPPATPPAAPPAPPTRRTVTVQPTGHGSWDASGGYWKDYLTQGGPSGKRSFWHYGSGIATARGAGTILAGTIYVERLGTTHGVSGAANVRLGTHPYGSRPGSGAAAHSAVAVVGTLLRGRGRALALSAAQIASLNGGAAGLGLEPGASAYDSPDYLRVTEGSPSGALALTIEG